MSATLELVGAGTGVVGAGLGLYNFWQARWGSAPKYAVEITHQQGVTYLARATGRTDFIATVSHLLPTEPTVTATLSIEGQMIAFSRATPKRFTMEAWGGVPPTGLVLVEVRSRTRVIADFPHSPEGWAAAQQQLPRP